MVLTSASSLHWRKTKFIRICTKKFRIEYPSQYSRLSITRTRTGDLNTFELWRVRVIESNHRGNHTETEKPVRVIESVLYLQKRIQSKNQLSPENTSDPAFPAIQGNKNIKLV